MKMSNYPPGCSGPPEDDYPDFIDILIEKYIETWKCPICGGKLHIDEVDGFIWEIVCLNKNCKLPRLKIESCEGCYYPINDCRCDDLKENE